MLMSIALPQHHIDRAVDDRFEFLARHLGAGADGDGVDGGGGELRQHRGSAFAGNSPFSLARRKQARERLVEFGKTFQHHGADLGIGHRLGGRRHHREAAARTGFAGEIDVERHRIDALQPLADRQLVAENSIIAARASSR